MGTSLVDTDVEIVSSARQYAISVPDQIACLVVDARAGAKIACGSVRTHEDEAISLSVLADGHIQRRGQ